MKFTVAGFASFAVGAVAFRKKNPGAQFATQETPGIPFPPSCPRRGRLGRVVNDAIQKCAPGGAFKNVATMAVNSVQRLQERLRAAAARRVQPAAEEGSCAASSDAEAGRGSLDPSGEKALPIGKGRRPESLFVDVECPCVANAGRSRQDLA